MCKDSNNLTVLDACIENYSYSNEEMFVKTVDGNGTDMSGFWKDELTFTSIGKCKTLNGSIHIGNDITKAFQIELNKSLSYMLMMFDPHFFSTTSNPRTMPRIYKTIEYTNSSPPNLWLYIEVIYHTKLNRPDQPCVESESYSFTACLRNHLIRKVGCHLEQSITASMFRSEASISI